MSRPILIPIACALAAAAVVGAQESESSGAEEDGHGVARPLIERAVPDASQRARRAHWRREFERQRPALEEALGVLELERRWWRGSTGRRRCARARAALARVDRAALAAAGDYRLVSATGRALDHLAAAVHACRVRRYFELDYRLDLAARELAHAAHLAAPP